MPSTCSKPALSNGSLRCIGATTHNEFRGIFERTRAVAPLPEDRRGRADGRADGGNPQGLKSRFEAHHGVKYTAAALTTAAELAARYINDRHLPDKAIDVIDESRRRAKILPKSRQKKVINKTEIEDIITKIARIPAKTVSNDDRSALKTWTAT